MFNIKTKTRIVNAAEQSQLQISIKPLGGRRAATAQGGRRERGVNQLSLFPPKVIRSELPFSLDTRAHTPRPKIGNEKRKITCWLECIIIISSSSIGRH